MSMCACPTAEAGRLWRVDGQTEKCGRCGADPFKKDNFKDAVMRLVAQVTARGVKRD